MASKRHQSKAHAEVTARLLERKKLSVCMEAAVSSAAVCMEEQPHPSQAQNFLAGSLHGSHGGLVAGVHRRTRFGEVVDPPVQQPHPARRTSQRL